MVPNKYLVHNIAQNIPNIQKRKLLKPPLFLVNHEHYENCYNGAKLLKLNKGKQLVANFMASINAQSALKATIRQALAYV